MAKKFYEFGVNPEETREYVVKRSFFLSVRNGPPEAVAPGDTVFLSRRTANEVFPSKKVEPAGLGKYFKVLHPTRVVTKDGEWLDVHAGDVVLLEREEALSFLRQGMIVEVDEEEVKK